MRVRYGMFAVIQYILLCMCCSVCNSGYNLQYQGSFCECAQPMRDNVTMKHHLSLAGRIQEIILTVLCYSETQIIMVTCEPRFQKAWFWHRNSMINFV